VRLQKYLAQAGVASRRHAEEMIAAGRVSVNGEVVTAMGVQVEAGDAVCVDGNPIAAAEEKVYILLFKPRGVVTTASDPQGRTTVLEILPGLSQRVYPVGRLDYDTEGALLLTNDGELAHRMMHPSYEIEKKYRVRVWGKVTEENIQALCRGVQLEDGLTAPAKAVIVARGADETTLHLTLHEGRNRQVRRMLEAVGFPVRELRRIAVGQIDLGTLKPGEWRHLSGEEIEMLYRCCDMMKQA